MLQANGVQLLLILLLCPETRYNPEQASVTDSEKKKLRRMYFRVGQISSDSLTVSEFWIPFKLFAFPNVLIPTTACSIVFGIASVFFTIEVPPLFYDRFGFNPEQNGLQFISLLVGSVHPSFVFNSYVLNHISTGLSLESRQAVPCLTFGCLIVLDDSENDHLQNIESGFRIQDSFSL